MPDGLNTTFRYLANTRNNAADDVLLAALDAPQEPVRDRALEALLDRRSPAGHHEIFLRFPRLDEHCREIISQRSDRLAQVVADVLRSGDEQECNEACDAVLSFRLYDALPVLIGVLSSQDVSHRQKVAQTILDLTELFYGELSSPEGQTRKRNRDALRQRITAALEEGIGKYCKHGSAEVVESFLLISKQQNVVLRRILHQSQDSCHEAVLHCLATSSRGGVLRLLLSFLEDSQMPQVVRNVIAARTDIKFVENLLAAPDSGSKNCLESLGRLDGFAWAQPGHPVLAGMPEEKQAQAARFLMTTAMKRKDLLEVIVYLLLEGKTAGRRAAAQAIREFKGPQADTAVIRALNDEDPAVRACALQELRPRNVPRAMSLLMRMADSPHEEVRLALREALPEFNLRHFIMNFDHMTDELLVTAGHLVRKIDTDAPWTLKMEMECLSPVRRRRAVLAAIAMGMVREMEQSIIRLLSDDDHMVRAAAAKALADCGTMPSWEALRDALLDRSVIVQEAAENSLLRIAQSLVPGTAEAAQGVSS